MLSVKAVSAGTVCRLTSVCAEHLGTSASVPAHGRRDAQSPQPAQSLGRRWPEVRNLKVVILGVVETFSSCDSGAEGGTCLKGSVRRWFYVYLH